LILLELNYLPPVSWMATAWRNEQIELEAQEHFEKGSYRNRCHIAGPNGVQRLSIPLFKGKHQQTPVREVRISYDEAWQRLHWRSIVAAYGSAPYFEHYAAGLERFYTQNFPFLFDFNLELLHWVCAKINCKTEFLFSETFRPYNVQMPDDFRGLIRPKQETRPEWFQPAPYSQVFAERHGFLEDLSVLDLLFCCGKRSGEILSDSYKSV
jgi:hypothetical protein